MPLVSPSGQVKIDGGAIYVRMDASQVPPSGYTGTQVRLLSNGPMISVFFPGGSYWYNWVKVADSNTSGWRWDTFYSVRWRDRVRLQYSPWYTVGSVTTPTNGNIPTPPTALTLALTQGDSYNKITATIAVPSGDQDPLGSVTLRYKKSTETTWTYILNNEHAAGQTQQYTISTAEANTTYNYEVWRYTNEAGRSAKVRKEITTPQNNASLTGAIAHVCSFAGNTLELEFHVSDYSHPDHDHTDLTVSMDWDGDGSTNYSFQVDDTNVGRFVETLVNAGQYVSGTSKIQIQTTAKDALDSGLANTISAWRTLTTPPAIPKAPTPVIETLDNPSIVRMSWPMAAGTLELDEYHLEYKAVEETDWNEVHITNMNDLSHLIFPVIVGKRYQYRMRYERCNDYGAWSDTITKTHSHFAFWLFGRGNR